MKYKIFISGYNEETQQILVSFSNDDTQREAADYPAYAFDLHMYPDMSADEIVQELLKVAPSYCTEQVTFETYQNDDEKSEAIRALVGREFEGENIFADSDHTQTFIQHGGLAQDSEEL